MFLTGYGVPTSLHKMMYAFSFIARWVEQALFLDVSEVKARIGHHVGASLMIL